MKALLLLVPLALIPTTASADCASIGGLMPKVLTPDKAALVGGGGILIAQVPSGVQMRPPAPPVSTWTLRDGTTKDTVIAPGLTVRVPVGKAKSTEFELVDGKTKAHVVTVYASDDLGAPVPVPDVANIVVTRATSYRESGQIHFKKPGVPEGVAAIVIADAKGTPREALLVKKGDLEANPVHGHCQQDPDGTLTTNTGDTVTLFYVDDHGRVSKPTKPMKVVAPKP